MSIKKTDLTATIICDKCQKTQEASLKTYNTIFWSEKWILNNGKKYEHLCYNCASSKQKKAINAIQARGL